MIRVQFDFITVDILLWYSFLSEFLLLWSLRKFEKHMTKWSLTYFPALKSFYLLTRFNTVLDIHIFFWLVEWLLPLATVVFATCVTIQQAPSCVYSSMHSLRNIGWLCFAGKGQMAQHRKRNTRFEPSRVCTSHLILGNLKQVLYYL